MPVAAVLSLAIVSAGCGDRAAVPGRQPLLVYAAASLATALPPISDAFRRMHPGVAVQHHFAASSLLARQIESGAEADVFISADPRWVDYLMERGRVDSSSRIEPIANKLVLIVPSRRKTQISNLKDLSAAAVERVAVADWSHVPAGRYAAEVLRQAGLWQAVRQKLIPAVDVRAALAYVARGDVDCGIVYATDALVSDDVRVVQVIADSLQPRIRYVAVRLSRSLQPLAAAYVNFLSGQEAAAVFRRYGFIPLTGNAANE